MSRSTLFQFVVLKHPTEKEVKEGKKSEVVVPPSGWELAKSEEEVVIKATRAIPDSEMEYADRLEVAVRPF